MGRATALTFAREGALVVGCDVAVEPAEETRRAGQGRGRRDGVAAAVRPQRSRPTARGWSSSRCASSAGSTCCSTSPAGRTSAGSRDVTDEEWDAARRDEVDLVFYLTRAAWPHLMASRGVVVNMASLNGSLSFKSLASLSHTTNKAAIIGMTRQLAMEGSEHGIRVNSISPGLIESGANASPARGRRGRVRPRDARAGRSWAVSASPRTSRTSRCSSPPTRARTSRASTSSSTAA